MVVVMILVMVGNKNGQVRGVDSNGGGGDIGDGWVIKWAVRGVDFDGVSGDIGDG